MYQSIKELAIVWGISERRIRVLCSEGKIAGAIRDGNAWKIPVGTEKPADGRFKSQAQALRSLEEKLQRLKSKRPLTQGELERLNEAFLTTYTYNSNAIEGNTLTLRETDLVLRGLTIAEKSMKEHLEVIGHKEAFLYVRDLVSKQEPLSERVMKEIHYLVLADKKEDRGVYRRIPVQIMGASHEPVQPYLIQPQMAVLLEQYFEREEALVPKLARFHLDFEGIHPFVDGNGRTGRLLVNLELMKAGYPPIDIKFTDRLRYYQAFEDYHRTGKVRAMEELFTAYLHQEIDRYLDIVK